MRWGYRWIGEDCCLEIAIRNDSWKLEDNKTSVLIEVDCVKRGKRILVVSFDD